VCFDLTRRPVYRDTEMIEKGVSCECDDYQYAGANE